VIVDPAWVICGPPDFAPHIENVVTLYDTLFDTAARLMTIPPNEEVYKRGALKGLAEINREFKAIGGTTLSSYKPNYATEIYPILARAIATKYVFAPSVGHHSPPLFDLKKLGKKSSANAANRQAVLAWIRDPNTPSTQNWPYMPKLLGDEPYKLAGGVIHKRVRLTLTPTQYALLQQWASGKFNESSSVPTPSPTKLSITPEGLDRAALENCVGGAFFPGIEVGWQMRNQLLFSSPFRIKHGAPSQYISEAGKIVKAGHFTRQMALPWQADFLQCKAENDTSGVFAGLGLFGWWPAQRPDSVFASEADLRAVPPRTSFWHRATSVGARISGPSGNPDLPSYDEMLNNWTKFGFIIEKKKDVFIEDQREADIP
jgi:hypothetical protein